MQIDIDMDDFHGLSSVQIAIGMGDFHGLSRQTKWQLSPKPKKSKKSAALHPARPAKLPAPLLLAYRKSLVRLAISPQP